MKALALYILQQKHVSFPADYFGAKREGHATLMQLVSDEHGSRLSWFESHGVGSFYRLSGDISDKLRGPRGKGALISTTDVIAEKFLTYRERDSRKIHDRDSRGIKAALEVAGSVRIDIEDPAPEHEPQLKKLKLSEDKEALTVESMLAFLALDDFQSNSVPVHQITRLMQQRLENIGVVMPADPQRLHAVQEYGNCEIKSLFALISHQVGEPAFQIIRTALIGGAVAQFEGMTISDWREARLNLDQVATDNLAPSDTPESSDKVQELHSRVKGELAERYAVACTSLSRELLLAANGSQM
ncbi:MAG: hypothetical protein EOO38_08330 [Cytophagaceae bacterium]|nr:MAG: hypothetical protein EOO38_08330 [Cytophagaceae bacterium]